MIKQFFRTEWSKLREMSFRDKRQYIWEYYRIQMFAAGIVIFIVGSMINIWFINPPKSEYLHFAWLYPHLPAEQLDSLANSINPIVGNPEREQVVVVSYAMSDNPEWNMAMHTRFFALIQVGAIDSILVHGSEIEGLASEFFLQPVYDIIGYAAIINPELYQMIYDRKKIITFAQGEHPEATHAMAISLRDAPLFTRLHFDTSELYLTMLSNASRPYELAKALEIIFDLNVPEVAG